jgi:hypothetical protein
LPKRYQAYPTIAMHRKPIEALADAFTEAEATGAAGATRVLVVAVNWSSGSAACSGLISCGTSASVVRI